MASVFGRQNWNVKNDSPMCMRERLMHFYNNFGVLRSFFLMLFMNLIIRPYKSAYTMLSIFFARGLSTKSIFFAVLCLFMKRQKAIFSFGVCFLFWVREVLWNAKQKSLGVCSWRYKRQKTNAQSFFGVFAYTLLCISIDF